MTHRKYKKFKAYIIKAENAEGMGLESFLITPIQRIPRYELLLMSCKKFTNPGHPDLQLIEEALVMVREVNKSNNSYIDDESQGKKQELHKMFKEYGVNLLLPQRKYLASYKELYVADVNHKEKKKIIMFLFSDLILLALHYSADKMEYYGHTELNEFSFCYSKQDLKYYLNLIKIVGKQKCFILVAHDRN